MDHALPTGSRWIALQKDAEWRWILDETAQHHASLGPLSFRALAQALARVAAPALIERDPRLQGRLDVDSLAQIASGVASSRGADWIRTASLSDTTEALSDAFLLFAALLLSFMPNPYAARQAEPWPLGNEGGFCNPMKLKMLDDNG